MIKYKIDIMAELYERGYTRTRIKQEKLLSESTVMCIKKGEPIGMKAIDSICRVLELQPGHLLKYVPDEN